MFNRRQLTQLFLLAPLAVKSATPRPPKRVLDAMFYANSPAPATYGAVHLPLAYEHNSFGGRGTAVPFWDSLSSQSMPTQARVKAVLSGYENYSGIICLDVERWNEWGDGGFSAGRRALQKYLDLLAMCRTVCPKASFGYYNMAPTVYSGKYFEARTSMAALSRVRAQNDLFAPLTEAQDVLFPTAYTVDLSEDHWRTYARTALDECIRVAPDKPRYPFLCPRYINVPGYGNVHLGARFLRTQMDFCLANADGFAMWGGGRKNIDFQSPWWRELTDVTARLSGVRPKAPTAAGIE